MKLPWMGSREGPPATRRAAAWFIRRTTRRPAAPPLLLPEVHVYETDKLIQVRVEGHDLDPRKLQIRRRGNLLTLSGLVRTDSAGRLRLYRRSIVLPPSADGAGITATVRRGLLIIRVPKVPAAAA